MGRPTKSKKSASLLQNVIIKNGLKINPIILIFTIFTNLPIFPAVFWKYYLICCKIFEHRLHTIEFLNAALLAQIGPRVLNGSRKWANSPGPKGREYWFKLVLEFFKHAFAGAYFTIIQWFMKIEGLAALFKHVKIVSFAQMVGFAQK